MIKWILLHVHRFINCLYIMVFAHTWVHIYTHTHTHACTQTRTHVHTHAHTRHSLTHMQRQTHTSLLTNAGHTTCQKSKGHKHQQTPRSYQLSAYLAYCQWALHSLMKNRGPTVTPVAVYTFSIAIGPLDGVVFTQTARWCSPWEACKV